MGHLQEFELALHQISEFPLTYETIIPEECHLFQDVRRYQTRTARLNVQMINIDGRITLDPEMIHVPMARLTSAEKKDFIEYLKLRITRGDNIGSTWAFFRPAGKQSSPKALTAYGANIVHRDAAQGQDRARQLLAALQKSTTIALLTKQYLKILLFTALIAALLFGGFKFGYLAKRLPFSNFSSNTHPREMAFYQHLFPHVYDWRNGDDPALKKIAKDLLKPEFITDLLSSMDQSFHYSVHTEDRNPGDRLVMFVYFNYNNAVKKALDKYSESLEGTELMRLARIYSCRLSGYLSNIFYFKVGDLDIKNAEISNFLKKNKISYRDYDKLRDTDSFSDLLEKDNISFKMKNFLEDVYTFTPLRIKAPVEGFQWYLLTQTDPGGNLDFAAFFQNDRATLVPRRIGDALLNGATQNDIFWYAVSDAKARELNLADNSLVYFSKTAGQALKLDLIQDKIAAMNLSVLSAPLQVTVHRELLMEDSKGKYGVQCYDPVTSLVLSNLITKSSFEYDNISLKRDPIQVNTTLVQLSKDDGFSTQSVTITPGKTGIINLFRDRDNFEARFPDGSTVLFERADVNLFNPFSFIVRNDSIAFSFKRDITDIKITLKDAHLKVVTASDGNLQILRTN